MEHGSSTAVNGARNHLTDLQSTELSSIGPESTASYGVSLSTTSSTAPVSDDGVCHKRLSYDPHHTELAGHRPCRGCCRRSRGAGHVFVATKQQERRDLPTPWFRSPRGITRVELRLNPKSLGVT